MEKKLVKYSEIFKDVFKEPANRRMEQIQYLSKQIDFNKLIYH